ncbi:MAG: fumarate hydratase C-terminal domain-containing protein [Clostridia bacterium]|nr:fumarate hydratase C-terminal domain-containing protein [Clostridia bacterium]
MKRLTLPLSKETIASLHAGDSVLLSGEIYTARDCAHKRIVAGLDCLPFPLENEIIYYAGPCPAPEGKACGSCGPTTSARMNSFAPTLLDHGLGGMIGKGEMSEEVIKALVRNQKVYFAAIGGAGAIYGNAVEQSTCVAYPDLLSEAVYRLRIKDFPLIVAIDSYGKTVY